MSNGQPLATTGPRWARPRWILAHDVLARAYGIVGGLVIITLSMIAIFGLLALYPEQSTALNLVDSKLMLLASSFIAASGYEPGLIILLALCALHVHGFTMIIRAITPDEQLSDEEIELMRQAGRKGWVIDCDGDYYCYGPNGERERFGAMADLAYFVAHDTGESDGSGLVRSDALPDQLR